MQPEQALQVITAGLRSINANFESHVQFQQALETMSDCVSRLQGFEASANAVKPLLGKSDKSTVSDESTEEPREEPDPKQ